MQTSKYTAFPLLLPIVVAMPAAWIMISVNRFGVNGAFAINLSVLGAIFVIYTKVREKRRTRELVSWGSASMTRGEKCFYCLGYLLIGSALFFTVKNLWH